MVIEKA